MAVVTTPEATARELLNVLVDNDCRSGEGIPLPSLRLQWGTTRPAADLEAGMRYALEQGWLELRNGGFFVVITAVGFDEA